MWYAVEKDPGDNDWETGTRNKRDAFRIALAFGKDSRIRIIDESGKEPVCVGEISHEEILESLEKDLSLSAGQLFAYGYLQEFYQNTFDKESLTYVDTSAVDQKKYPSITGSPYIDNIFSIGLNPGEGGDLSLAQAKEVYGRDAVAKFAIDVENNPRHLYETYFDENGLIRGFLIEEYGKFKGLYTKGVETPWLNNMSEVDEWINQMLCREDYER